MTIKNLVKKVGVVFGLINTSNEDDLREQFKIEKAMMDSNHAFEVAGLHQEIEGWKEQYKILQSNLSDLLDQNFLHQEEVARLNEVVAQIKAFGNFEKKTEGEAQDKKVRI